MTGVVQGNDVLFQLKRDDVFVDFVCAKDIAINPQTTYVNITTYGDGMWDKHSPQSHKYGITMSGVVKFDSANFTAFDFLEAQIQGVETEFRAIFTDAEGVNTKVIYGSFFVENSNLTGNVGQVALGDFSLIGNGLLKISSCHVLIESVTTEVTGNDVEVTLNGVEGNPIYYFYQIDEQFEQTALTNPFTVSGLEGGFHTIIVTPVCTEDNRGLEVQADFHVQASTPTTTCPNITGINITAVQSTSFEVYWTMPPTAVSVDIYLENMATQNHIPYLAQTGTSKTFTNLTPGTPYQVRFVTNCVDAVQSGGIVAHTVTAAAPNSIGAIFVNNHSEITMDYILLYPLPVEWMVVFGAIPLAPLSQAAIVGVPEGEMQIVMNFTNAGVTPGTVTVTTENGQQQQTIGSQNTFSLTVGSGGIEILISP